MSAIQPYIALARLDHPIGIWLLLFPCWWGQMVAAIQGGHPPNLWYTLLFGLGAVVMRSSGCVINDILDRDLDAQVARTRHRPLASGHLSLTQAIVFLVVLLALGLAILLNFNRLTLLWGAASLLLVFTYPLMKRITWWPQVFLGLTFNWGVLLGTTAELGRLQPASLILYAGCVFWTLGYDTIYAHQDKKDDAKIGVRSTALLWGKHSRLGVAVSYGIAWSLWVGAILIGQETPSFPLYLGLIGCLILLALQVGLWQPDDPENCSQTFRFNQWIGWTFLGGLYFSAS